jgi:valyl-tRNA synthetase
MDTAFDEKVLKVGKRLVTKLFNAGKYVLGQSLGDAETLVTDTPDVLITHEIDRALIGKLRALVESATKSFAEFEYAHALMATEQFFWSQFTDAYLELVKARARGETPDDAGRVSAVITLRVVLNVLLRAFAPFVPYISEEVWSWAFAEEAGQPSVHRAPWPTTKELAGIRAPKHADSFDVAIELMTAINKKKTELGASVGRVVKTATIALPASRVEDIAAGLPDVLSSTKIAAHTIVERATEGDAFVVEAMEVAPKEDKSEPAA